MAADKPRDPRDEKDRPQDPLVERLRPDPAQPAEPTKTLSGLLGDSDRPDHRRLYFTAELDYYAEFRGEDVLAYADIPPDQPPFLGEQATRVTLRRDATVAFTRTQHARPLDEFDLDVRLAAFAGPIARPRLGRLTENPIECGGDTDSCETCGGTCDCRTQDSCANTCGDRCPTEVATRCGTCHTCVTDCGGCTAATQCGTCATQCGTCQTCQTCHTCGTCDTCNPHVPACRA
jgi:hypothetical protein